MVMDCDYIIIDDCLKQENILFLIKVSDIEINSKMKGKKCCGKG